DPFNDGAIFEPVSSTWKTLPAATDGVTTATMRYGHVAVWTGTQMIIQGGEDINNNFLTDGWKYTPSAYNPPTDYGETGTWKQIAAGGGTVMTLGGPPAAVWTGSKMIVWTAGGGSIYTPGSDSWSTVT